MYDRRNKICRLILEQMQGKLNGVIFETIIEVVSSQYLGVRAGLASAQAGNRKGLPLLFEKILEVDTKLRESPAFGQPVTLWG